MMFSNIFFGQKKMQRYSGYNEKGVGKPEDIAIEELKTSESVSFLFLQLF